MGKRKGVEAHKNVNREKNGNENGESWTSTSSSSMEMSRGGTHTTDNKIEGGGNLSKKIKRGESSNSSSGEAGAGAGQSQRQESSVQEISMDDFPPENVSANADEEPSTSSSYFLWNRSGKEAPCLETGVLDLSIKRKTDRDGSSNSQDEDEDDDEDEVVTEGPINDLPPEMLTKILKCEDTQILFKCRLVSRQWLEISSQVLTGRTDSVFNFQYCAVKWVSVALGPSSWEKTKSKRLQEFVECMKKCKSIPYTRFSFDFESPSFFDDRDWLQFQSIFAPSENPNPNQKQQTKIKCLRLKCDYIRDTETLRFFTEKLRDLLLRKIPRLEELALDFSTYRDDFKNFKLFPPSKHLESELTTTANAATSSASVPVQLPYLKVLVIEAGTILYFSGIIEDLLNAAVNLTDVYVKRPLWNGEVFQFLHSLGKLHLLKAVKIDVQNEFLFDVKKLTQNQHSNFLLGFKLRELKLHLSAWDISPNFHAAATNFISNLLESSKDTLGKMQISPLGFLHGLQFPKFTKLKTLYTYQCNDDWYEGLGVPLFPPGIRSISRSREIFPAVDVLSVRAFDWESALPQEDSIPIFPRVQDFFLLDHELVKNAIAKLELMCPNLKHCVIKKVERNPEHEHFNFAQVGREIWTHLKQLESLEVDLETNLEAHDFPALDSCFTGISEENCRRLQELMEVEKTRNENSSEVKLPESEELKKLTQREHPSILDLTNLKTLTMNTFEGETRIEGKHFFTTKFTWISEEFAFKLMSQLQFNGKRPSATS